MFVFARRSGLRSGIPEDIKVATTLCSFKRQFKSFYTLTADARAVQMQLIALRQIFRNYFFNRIAIIWSGIPKDIKVATTLCSFKRQFKSFYFKRLFNVFDGPKCRRVNILKACSC